MFRLYYCDSGTNNLSADPTVTCGSGQHVLYVLVCTCLSMCAFFGLPLLLFRSIHKNLIYRNRTDHEKKLQIWEILYMLKIDSFWIKKQVWIVSSFNLNGAYFRFHMLLLKAILLFVSIFIRSDFILQSTLFFCILLFFGAYYCLMYVPFRTNSSNMVLWTVCAAWIFDSAFAMVNAYGVTSAVTVASTQAYLLLIFNILACLVVLSITVYSALFLSVLDWPTLRTFRRIHNSKTLFPAVTSWVVSYNHQLHLIFNVSRQIYY